VRKSGIAGALVVAVLSTLFLGVPAQAAGEPVASRHLNQVRVASTDPGLGSVTVNVTAWATGAAATGGCVSLSPAAGGAAIATQCTGSAGTYVLDNIAPGDYLVRAYNFSGLTEMWTGPALSSATATSVAVTADTATPVSIRLLTSSQVAGRVVDADGNPIAGATVQAWNVTAKTLAGTSTTSGDGWFVRSLCAQACRITASAPGLAREFYPNGSDASAAASINSPGPQLLGPLVLDMIPGSITGTIQPPPYMTGLPACVQLFEKWTTGTSIDQYRVATQCGVAGTPYTFSSLPATTYYICYVPSPGTTQCLSAAGHNTLGSDAAPTPLTVTQGGTTTVPAFGAPYVVSGQVSSGGGPVTYVNSGCVDLYDVVTTTRLQRICEPVDALYTFTVSDDSRTYRAFGWGFADRSDGWVSNAFTVVDGVTATPGSLTALNSTWGSISGTITLPSGSSATQGCVMAFDEAEWYSESDYFQEACANPVTGAYQLALPAGRYKLQFYVHGADVATEWNDNARTAAAAPFVTVLAGPATTGVNAALERAGYIAATVTGAGGAPISGACVSIYMPSGQYLETRCGDSLGRVNFDSRSAGKYRLYLEAGDGYPGRWFGGTGLAEGAASYTITAGSTTNASVSVASAGVVGGTVTGPSGASATGGCVDLVETETSETVASVCDIVGGAFSVPVMPGTYYALYSGWSTTSAVPLADAWFGGADSAAAQLITVVAGGTATADRQLSAGARVVVTTQAKVDSSTTAPAYGGCVHAYTSGSTWISSRCSDGESSVVFHLAAGSYKFYGSEFVRFGGTSYPRLTAAWYSVPALSTASNYTVSPGATTGTLTLAMGPGVEFVGTVNVSGVRASGGFVDVFGGSAGTTYITTVPVSETGTFMARGLAWGDRARFYFYDVPGAAEQFQDQSKMIVAAGWITVPAAPSGDQVDVRQAFNLVPGGTVTGTLITPEHMSTEPLCVVLHTVYSSSYYPVREVCGTRGSSFTIPNILPGVYYAEYTSANGGWSWWNASGEWSGINPTAITVAAGGTYNIVPRVVEISGPSFVTPGSPVTLTINAFPPVTQQVQDWWYCDFYGGTCGHMSGTRPTLTNGTGSFTVTPTNSTVYYVSLSGVDYVNGHGVEVVTPAMVLAGPTTGKPNDTVTYTMTSDIPVSGTGRVWTRTPGGTWTQTSQTVAISNGNASFTTKVGWRPIEYRVNLGYSMSYTITMTPTVPIVNRIGGPTRYEVPVGISQTYFPDGADTVYLATGGNFPDALGAAPAAALRDAPLMLVEPNAIPAGVKAELLRLDPTKIIVTGGPASVSDAVLAQLHDYAPIVSRINGPDRYEVSRRVTRDAFEDVGSDIAYIATGATFPDALSASAAAGSVQAPVILLDGQMSTLDSATAQLLLDLGVKDVRIAGGPGSVKPGIETALRNLPGVTTVTRLTGADRFIVSGATNRAAFTSSDVVFIASGYNFPDALAGAPVAGALGAPLYVIPTSCIPGYVLDDIANLGATEVRILGGPGSVTPEAAAFARC
jgi:putative cell wall-binding protein